MTMLEALILLEEKVGRYDLFNHDGGLFFQLTGRPLLGNKAAKKLVRKTVQPFRETLLSMLTKTYSQTCTTEVSKP